jgi:hypothetical protein
MLRVIIHPQATSLKKIDIAMASNFMYVLILSGRFQTQLKEQVYQRGKCHQALFEVELHA